MSQGIGVDGGLSVLQKALAFEEPRCLWTLV
jgi:hypothetical protein